MIFQLVTPVCAAAFAGDCVGGPDADVATIQGITCVMKNLLGPLPALLALVAVVMIILAGVRLIAAGSDAKAVASAWQMLTWAIIGLVLVSAIWLVLVLIQSLTGAQVTQFGFPN